MIVTNSRINRQRMACVLPMGAVLRFGGDSASATTNSTEVRDMRVVGAQDSVNLSANDSNVTVFATDQGAIAAGAMLGVQGLGVGVQGLGAGLQGMSMGHQLGTYAIDANAKNTSAVLSSAQSMFAGALGAIKENAASSTAAIAGAYRSTASDLATAFTDSKAPDKSILTVVAWAAVAMAAIFMFSRKA